MKKILIVDDMIVSLMMTENMLAGSYTTFCASSGKEAIEIYRKERPDMILSDLRMPGMSGYELQTTLQSEFHERIPFMFMTADHDEETENKGFDNGAMDFIRKPFRPDVLLRRVGNILQTVEQIQKLKKDAGIDKLTGLLNKSSSEAELGKLCKNSTGALLMIDLDSFKLVNDLHGHAAGDEILVSFADIIRSTLRPSDLAGRLGGDEFIAFCHGVLEESAISQKTQFINRQIVESAKKILGEDMNIPLGASIGCVFVPQWGTEFQNLFKKADKSLYIVKQNGKHGYSIFSDKQKFSDVTDLENMMRILDERNQSAGALNLPMEGFRAVFRFIRRGEDGSTAFILFTLTEKGNVSEMTLGEASEMCTDMITENLRKTDVLTQSSTNQYVALVRNIRNADEVQKIINRFLENWNGTRAGESFSVSCEFEQF